MSANRQRPFAGAAHAAVFNTWRRFRNQVFYFAPPFVALYFILDWAEKKYVSILSHLLSTRIGCRRMRTRCSVTSLQYEFSAYVNKTTETRKLTKTLPSKQEPLLQLKSRKIGSSGRGDQFRRRGGSDEGLKAGLCWFVEREGRRVE